MEINQSQKSMQRILKFRIVVLVWQRKLLSEKQIASRVTIFFLILKITTLLLGLCCDKNNFT